MGKTSFFNTGITEEKLAYEKTFFVNTWIIEEHYLWTRHFFFFFFFFFTLEWLKNDWRTALNFKVSWKIVCLKSEASFCIDTSTLFHSVKQEIDICSKFSHQVLVLVASIK